MSLRLSLEEYEELKQYVLNRDGFKCRNCGYRNALHIHHIVFRSAGGADKDENLCVLCSSCHDGVHLGGLTIVEPANAEEHLVFKRDDGWRPQ